MVVVYTFGQHIVEDHHISAILKEARRAQVDLTVLANLEHI
jgi:hypothetical protein